MTPEVIEYPDRAIQAETLADAVAVALQACIEANKQATLAVAGGSTPATFLTALGKRDIDWTSVIVLPTDERWAPPKDDRSNEGMIRDTLMANGANPQLFSFWRKGATAVQAAPGLALDLATHLPLDICVLGMGVDMHCASLFPGGDGMTLAMADGAPAVASMLAPGAAEPRVTLSADVLSKSQMHLLIAGDDKRAALDKALGTEDTFTAPVAAVLRRCEHATVHWAP